MLAPAPGLACIAGKNPEKLKRQGRAPEGLVSMAYNPVIELLIIDDDMHVLAVLEDLFSGESDVAVTAMSDSVEAIELIHKRSFDMVITDLMMPKADGLAVTRAVQETNKDSLVIIVTGFASLETTLEAIHLGVYDYITKPFQIDEFRLLVANASKRIRLERENADLKALIKTLEHEIESMRENAAEESGLPGAKSPGGLPMEVGLNAARPTGPDPNKISVYERVASRGPGAPVSDESGAEFVRSGSDTTPKSAN